MPMKITNRDVVPLDHQREGHAQYEQPDGEYGAKQED